jgi:hypothetical protein
MNHLENVKSIVTALIAANMPDAAAFLCVSSCPLWFSVLILTHLAAYVRAVECFASAHGRTEKITVLVLEVGHRRDVYR